MSYLLKNVLLPSFSQTLEILISEGKIVSIKESVDAPNATVLDLSGKLLTPGWFDLASDFGDPGYESREDVYSGCAAAVAGGFTDVCVLPYTSPALDTKGTIAYLLRKSAMNVADVHVVANVSRGGEGTDLSELMDLSQAGARYFSDVAPIGNAMLLLKALQYTRRFGGVVADRPCNLEVARFGQMHEGEVSTSLGLRGVPKLAEILAVQRDIEILNYTGGRLHLTGISCSESVALIRRAKDQGLGITCDVPLLNLVYTDVEMAPFDTSFKAMPPFRSEEDRKELLKGLQDGTIDAIASHHQPRTPEEKDLEFDLADFGIITLQTAFPMLKRLEAEVDLSLLIEKFSNGPRTVVDLPIVEFEEGQVAKFSIFDTDKLWKFDTLMNQSKSTNSPHFDHGLEGLCLGVINGERVHLPGFDA